MLRSKYGSMRFGGMVAKAFQAAQGDSDKSSVYKDIDESSQLDREQFSELLKTIDLGLRALPATAQVRVCRCCRDCCA